MKTVCNTWNLCWSKLVFRGILKVENQPIISSLFLKLQATNYQRTPARWHIVGHRTESKIDWNKNRKEIQLIFALLWFPRRVIFNYESILYIRKINIYNWKIFLWWIFRMLTYKLYSKKSDSIRFIYFVDLSSGVTDLWNFFHYQFRLFVNTLNG